MQFEGRSRTEISVNDLSVVLKGGIQGKVAVLIEAERGDFDTFHELRTWTEYRKYFGELGEKWSTPNATVSPLLIQRMIDAGATVVAARIEHYTDPADKGTGTSVKPFKILTAGSVTFTGATAGNYKVSVTVAAAASGLANKYDVFVTLQGFPELSENNALTYRDFPKVVTAADASLLAKTLKYVTVSTGTIDLGVGITTKTIDLDGGSYAIASIVATDIIGDATAGTGIHVFDEAFDMYRICVPHVAMPTVDIALANYADFRGDIRAILRTPVGVTADSALDYRNGTGVYSHVPVDTWRASMFTGGLKIVNPVTQLTQEITEVADVCGIKAYRDNNSRQWFAAAGADFPVRNSLGVVYNFGTSARKVAFDDISKAGINAIINHPNFGLVIWGNETLQKKKTLLSHENVAELMIYMWKSLMILAEVKNFKPNDIETWKSIHRRVTPFLDNLVNERAIWADYLYQGDQNVDRVEDCVVNTPANIDAGGYVARIYIKPITALKYIGVEINVTNSGVNLKELSELV